MELQVENHIEINGVDRLMSELTYEERNRAWNRANETCMRELGFEPVNKAKNDKTA